MAKGLKLLQNMHLRISLNIETPKKLRIHPIPIKRIWKVGGIQTLLQNKFAIICLEWERLKLKKVKMVLNHLCDTFGAVMELDHPGRVRLYERGVTKTLLKQNAGDSGPSLSVANNKMMQKRMDELGERMQQTMLEN
ncbi:hypothetical protein HAX54_013041 [Datura stramonium]|uniref:Uncharacterized protein n=1 Tax=Datura stramonium TaxID=4076 RepID=A0ABS8TKQ2_DATST|nr:hypothetical protein [Datura stramonium]